MRAWLSAAAEQPQWGGQAETKLADAGGGAGGADGAVAATTVGEHSAAGAGAGEDGTGGDGAGGPQAGATPADAGVAVAAELPSSRGCPVTVSAKFKASDHSISFLQTDAAKLKKRGEAGDHVKVLWRVPFEDILRTKLLGRTLTLDVAQVPKALSWLKKREGARSGKWVAGTLPLAEMQVCTRYVIRVGESCEESLARIVRAMERYDQQGESARLASVRTDGALPAAPRYGDDECKRRVKEAASLPIQPCRYPLTGAHAKQGEAWRAHEHVHLVLLARLARFLLYGGVEKSAGWGFPHQCGDCPRGEQGGPPWCGYTSLGMKVRKDTMARHFLCDGVYFKHKSWLDARLAKTAQIDCVGSGPAGSSVDAQLAARRAWLAEEAAMNPLCCEAAPPAISEGEATGPPAAATAAAATAEGAAHPMAVCP